MMRAILLVCALGMASAAVFAPKQQDPKDLLCTICVDLVTDIDEFLTSAPTEQQIVEFVEQLCQAMGAILPDLVSTCNALVEAQLPAIIEGIVNDNLNPQQVCASIGACSA
eukprot:TRINITY_DN13831_c0_g1_i1.p2 TRINITY_DN13831_c0_g1~~TRINITY_DN13831_c0_g1_i1.p2  ORF type:complete len:119 (-),score=48.83 TRINITY_DN13831_c0_g1_i1:58-390(-)